MFWGPMVAKSANVSEFPSRYRDGNPILVIHGGCWSNAYGVDHVHSSTPPSGLMYSRQYRQVGDKGGGWQGSLEDVSRLHATSPQSRKRLLLVGHSAGGHLALKAAEDPDLSMTGVIALAPITDLVSYGAETGSCQSMVPKFMGDYSYSPSDAYREASVRIEDITVPIKVVIGDADPIVGPTQVDSFSSEQLRTIPEAGHFDLIHPQTPAFEAIKSIIQDWLGD